MNKTSGFSLVELLVGMLVGLIGTVVIFQIFAVAEGQKRTTTSGGDAAQSAAYALFSLERDLRMAGQGFNNKGLLGCSIRVYGDMSPPPKSRLQGLVPSVVTVGIGNAPDSLSISYISSDVVNPPAALQASVTGNGAITVDSLGFTQVGDVMVLSNLKNGNINVVAGVPDQCSMFQVTSIPVGTTQLGHNPVPGTYVAPGLFVKPITLNHASGLDNGLSPSLTFPPGVLDTGGYVYNMGNSPLVSATYFVNTTTNRLMRRDDMGNTANPIEIADGIVQMKVLYGIDTNGDNQISTSEWTNATPATPLAWQRLRAVKLALVARSALKEKADPVTGLCTTTTVQPLWYGAGASGADIPLDVSADPNWKCYRYKVFQTVAPIRNMAWMPFR